MKKKMVWRYWCDFCRKGGCSAFAARSHELHCTLNPKRECRICKNAGTTNKGLKYLIVLARNDLEELKSLDEELQPASTPEEVVNRMMDAAEYCPMCVFAAIRQSGMNKYVTDEGTLRVVREPLPFDLKKELEKFWKEQNEYDYQREASSAAFLL